MSDPLADALQVEVPCEASEAAVLADLARTRLRPRRATTEDTDEDLVVLLRDPRVFGTFAEAALADGRLGSGVRHALVEHAFDLLPLPLAEGDVIEVGARAPPRLLALAAFLARSGDLTVLHVMHLLYAIFLDRSLVSQARRATRAVVLREVLRQDGSSEGLRVFYGALHLATVPESEARRELRGILRARTLPMSLRRTFARLAADEDGGRPELTRLAQAEGLLPGDLADLEGPMVLANVPRLPGRLAPLGRRYLQRRARS